MPLLEPTRAEKLIQVARERFNPEPNEAELNVMRDSFRADDPPEPDANAPRPEVRAEFIRWLATDPRAAPLIEAKGVRVCGVTITGKMDFETCRVRPVLYCLLCTFREGIDLVDAEIRGIFLIGCTLEKGMSADRIVVKGPMSLRGTESAGTITLRGARIASSLDFDGAHLTAPDRAVSADGISVGGSVTFSPGFQAAGEVRMLWARIQGQLICSGAKLLCKEDAFSADQARIGAVLMDAGFESAGAVRLPGARIVGNLDCRHAKFLGPAEALTLDAAQIGGSVYLSQEFVAKGAIRFAGVRVEGDVTVFGATIGNVLCTNMRICGDLIWQRIQSRTGARFIFSGVKVKTLRDAADSWPAEAVPTLGGLEYEELILHATATADQVARNVYSLKELPLEAADRVAWIMRQSPEERTASQPWMQLRDLLLKRGDQDGAKHVLYMRRCLKARSLQWHPVQSVLELLGQIKGKFELLAAPHSLWPYFRHPNRLWAIGFAWLEENPLRILYPITCTLLLGTLIFSGASPGRSGAMIPVPSGESEAAAKMAEARTPPFQPFVYTLENALPLVKLGMDEKWEPDPSHVPQPWFPKLGWLDWLKWFNSYWFLAVSRWLLILSGWFQATVLAAALSGRFKE